MKTLLSFLLLLVMVKKISAQTSPDIKGKIVTENKNGLLKVKGTVINNSALHLDLNYILISIKKGPSGNSSTKQSGKFSVNPQEMKVLSESNFKLSKNDALKIFLFIKQEQMDQLISKDSLEINSDQFDDNVSYIPEADIELGGLTVDDTKTRMGQAFYDIFFRKYSMYPKKYEGTITISELPSFGRSSRILVLQNDQVVYSFQSKPDEEYLETETVKVLAILEEYNSETNFRNREFKY